MNMDNWNKVKTPPPAALTTIQAGRLKGMSDIKPMWRYQIMTEVYGLCGIGWKYVVVNKWLEPGSDNQIFAFADVELYVKVDGEWTEPIQGNGGSMLVTKEKAGLHSNDEAYKMAITDALSTAMKMIGVAADVYLGNWDGRKYKEETIPPKQIIIGQDNVNWLIGFCKGHNILNAKDKQDFQDHYKFSPYETTPEQFEKIKAKIEIDFNEV